MAAGEFRLFDAAVPKLGNGTINLAAHTLKWAALADTHEASVADADPCFGAGGSTNLAAHEVAAGGNYPAGGVALTGVSYTQTSGVTRLTSDGLALAQHPANPSAVRRFVIYDDTAAAKDALGFGDLGGLSDFSAGAFEWNVPVTGWFSQARGTEE